MHEVGPDETKASIAEAYGQSIADLVLANPDLADREVEAGETITILSRERLDRLGTIQGLSDDLATIDEGIVWLEQAVDALARAELPQLRQQRSEKVAELQAALEVELLQAAGSTTAWNSEALAAALDERVADLQAVGLDDPESVALLEEARNNIETGLDSMFEPLQGKIEAAMDDPWKWDEVEAELTEQFAALAEDNPQAEAAINQAREALITFGPDDPGWRGRVDAAMRTVLVTRPAEQVAEAYEEGGADAAISTLEEIAGNLTPETTALVIEAAWPTLQNAIGDLGTFLEARQAPAGYAPGEIEEELGIYPDEFQHAISDLNAIVSQLSRVAAGQGAIEDIAGELAKAMPDVVAGFEVDEEGWNNELATVLQGVTHSDDPRYGPDGEFDFETGQPPVLALALADKLIEQGRTTEAEVILSATTRGLEQRYAELGAEAYESLMVTSGIPADWHELVGTETAEKYLEENPELVSRVNDLGLDAILLLEALNKAPESLESLDAWEGFESIRSEISNDGPLSVAILSSQDAWTELGRMTIQSAGLALEGTPEVPPGAELNWAERAVISYARAFQTYSGTAFPNSNLLTGKPFFLPPSRDNTRTAVNAGVLQSLPEEYRALAQANHLNTPGVLTDADSRQTALTALNEVFDTQKPSVNSWLVTNLLLGTDGTLTPRGGPSSTSPFGRGLNAIMAPLSVGDGLVLLEAGAQSSGFNAILSQTFGWYLQGAALREAMQLAAGLHQSKIANLELPRGGFFDRITRSSGVHGYKSWEWLPRQFDLFGNLLLTAYVGKFAADGDWARAGAMAMTTAGGWWDFAATVMKKSPKWNLVGLGLSTAGVILDTVINEYRNAEAAARFEDPTREYLELAGIRPEIANELANYDSEGNSVAPVLVELAEYRGQTPEEFMNFLNEQSADDVHQLVATIHQMEPNADGTYPQTHEDDEFALGPDGGYLFDAPETPYIMGDLRVRSIRALDAYAESLFS